MKDYSKGKIYCIRSFQTDKVYVGSTIQELSMRMVGHRANYKKYLNGKYHYVSSFEIIQYGDCYIELIKLYPCSCRSELEREEGQYIRNIDCVNKQIAGRTSKEYYKDEKKNFCYKGKIYRENNKAKIAVKMKEYREKNKEKIAIKDKKYREKNKAILTEKFNCLCGGRYTRQDKSRHLKTKLHQKYLNEKI